MTDIIEVLIDADPEIVEVQVPGAQGPAGPRGPDPWLDPVQVIDAAGATTIDYDLGKHVRLRLTGNATVTVAHWPETGRIARLTLEIENMGAFTLTLPGVLWPAGIAPAVTPGPGGRDLLILATTTAGAIVFGLAAGRNFT